MERSGLSVLRMLQPGRSARPSPDPAEVVLTWLEARRIELDWLRNPRDPTPGRLELRARVILDLARPIRDFTQVGEGWVTVDDARRCRGCLGRRYQLVRWSESGTKIEARRIPRERPMVAWSPDSNSVVVHDWTSVPGRGLVSGVFKYQLRRGLPPAADLAELWPIDFRGGICFLVGDWRARISVRGPQLRFVFEGRSIAEKRLQGAGPFHLAVADVKRIYAISSDGVLTIGRIRQAWTGVSLRTKVVPLALPDGTTVSSISPGFRDRELFCGLSDGQIGRVHASFVQQQAVGLPLPRRVVWLARFGQPTAFREAIRGLRQVRGEGEHLVYRQGARLMDVAVETGADLIGRAADDIARSSEARRRAYWRRVADEMTGVDDPGGSVSERVRRMQRRDDLLRRWVVEARFERPLPQEMGLVKGAEAYILRERCPGEVGVAGPLLDATRVMRFWRPSGPVSLGSRVGTSLLRLLRPVLVDPLLLGAREHYPRDRDGLTDRERFIRAAAYALPTTGVLEN